MSTNCMKCGFEKRTGPDLLCNECRVIDLLKSHGYEAHGATETIVQASAGTTFAGGRPHGGKLVPGRTRFKKGELRATVGARTTCLYRVENRNVTDSHNFKTQDVDAIRNALNSTRSLAKAGDGL